MHSRGIQDSNGHCSNGYGVGVNVMNMQSDIPNSRFLNKSAWGLRWRDRDKSWNVASNVLELSQASCLDEVQIGLALRTIAWQAKWRGSFDTALNFCERALTFLQGTEAHAAMADVHSILANVHFSQSRMDIALEAVQSGYDHLARQENAETRIDLLTTEATTLSYHGRTELAFDRLYEALDMAEGLETSRLKQNFGRLYYRCGAYDDAHDCCVEGIAMCKAQENRVVLPYIYEVLGRVHLALGQTDEAEGYLLEGLKIGEEDRDRRVICHLHHNLAEVAEARGQHEEALTHLDKSETLSLELEYPCNVIDVCRTLAGIYEAMGNYPAALEAMKSVDRLHQDWRT